MLELSVIKYYINAKEIARGCRSDYSPTNNSQKQKTPRKSNEAEKGTVSQARAGAAYPPEWI